MNEHTDTHAAHTHGTTLGTTHGTQVEPGSVIDPVCGMSVDPHTTPHRHIHRGLTYYFCSAGCRTKFAADAARYVSPAATAAPAVTAGTIYTCPMHPQIRQVGPGSCPICGMALEPVVASSDGAPNLELVEMTRRLWIEIALVLTVVAVEMGGHLVELRGVVRQNALQWLKVK